MLNRLYCTWCFPMKLKDFSSFCTPKFELILAWYIQCMHWDWNRYLHILLFVVVGCHNLLREFLKMLPNRVWIGIYTRNTLQTLVEISHGILSQNGTNFGILVTVDVFKLWMYSNCGYQTKKSTGLIGHSDRYLHLKCCVCQYLLVFSPAGWAVYYGLTQWAIVITCQYLPSHWIA